MRLLAIRGWVIILCLSFFSACTLSTIKISPMSFLYGYESALRDYKAGRIMEAMNTVIHMNKSRLDYADAKALLKKKINPARLRLLRHYVRAAKRAEKSKIWFRAKALYKQAASFSISNTALLKKVHRMDLRMRQVRMDTLIIQRRKEDAQLLNSLTQYDAPKGLAPQDAPFSRQREKLKDWVLSRASDAQLAAKLEMWKGYPEVAYVEIESFNRLRPDSAKGKILMGEIKKVLPKGLHVHPVDQPIAKISPVTTPKTISANAIRKLIKNDEWLKAKRYAVVYQREGGKHADRFLKTIEKNMDRQAATAFKAGRIAFRLEHLDQAVERWRQAVALRPGNMEYLHSLTRALQLQERLRILRSEADTDKGRKKIPPKKTITPSK
ncbi:MAG: 4-hydroxy-3-methylbut-2-en-1-yl diphosphate synthase [Mariprofundaceae bacterium]|nr:4-hydroxy-3-methylbut-2-en-1-yl diphosphate synthase [Mariprofundaceae bacterium]